MTNFTRRNLWLICGAMLAATSCGNKDDDGFGLVVQNGEDSVRVALQMVELVFLGDALGVIKDRWLNTHMEDIEYEFADN